MTDEPSAATQRGELTALSAAVAAAIAEHPRYEAVKARLEQIQSEWACRPAGGPHGEAKALLELWRAVEIERARRVR